MRVNFYDKVVVNDGQADMKGYYVGVEGDCILLATGRIGNEKREVWYGAVYPIPRVAIKMINTVGRPNAEQLRALKLRFKCGEKHREVRGL